MILKHFLPHYAAFNPEFNFLFNSYYNTIGPRVNRHERGLISRPSVKNVYAYREFVDQKMQMLLASEVNQTLRDLIILGLNHEEQHQELLLTDIKYSLSKNALKPVYTIENDFVSDALKATSFIKISEGVYDIGSKSNGFCFDNELGRHKVFLHEFDIATELVSNAEFIQFIDAGGYQDASLWLDDGWAWLKANEIAAPLYWQKNTDAWHHFTLAGMKPVQLNAPLCHISFYEAAAFAAWKKMRLPTEFEWETASAKLNWGSRWEWTNSAYLPYPNYKIAEGAVGEYNGKFMINQMVLRGSSAATAAGHSRETYRNFFQPEHRWQFTGIRLAK
jgi:ergothioneine biosynthesis protein EgtB